MRNSDSQYHSKSFRSICRISCFSDFCIIVGNHQPLAKGSPILSTNKQFYHALRDFWFISSRIFDHNTYPSALFIINIHSSAHFFEPYHGETHDGALRAIF